MGTAKTTSVQIDTALLAQLRECFPGGSDQELLETAARIRLGRDAIRDIEQHAAMSEEDPLVLGFKPDSKTR
jgi:hypothetical protein